MQAGNLFEGYATAYKAINEQLELALERIDKAEADEKQKEAARHQVTAQAHQTFREIEKTTFKGATYLTRWLYKRYKGKLKGGVTDESNC